MEEARRQELEWLEAQKINISVDLVAAAKQQLKFLAAVDRNRWIYEGPALYRAIYRYNVCWLPLLAQYSELTISGPLVVPLDCEWIWHCHRLNPVRYKADCEELYGNTLDSLNVASSVNGNFKKPTEEIWKLLYPEEPYDMDLESASSEDFLKKMSACAKCTDYDLISAVQRQRPFYYQVSRDHVNNEIFLAEAEARYKAFLHLIKRNRERSINQFCVPTYDIDLMWHTHQLHPLSYCTDLEKALGKVLEHDDTDSDRSKGKKLDNGFSKTTAQWEDTFGKRYWKAGAMYRGKPPSSVTTVPFVSDISEKKFVADAFQDLVQCSEVNFVEVLLEIVEIKNLSDREKGSVFISVSKRQPDALFTAKRRLTIFPESSRKQIASFHCETKGEILFELMLYSPSKLPFTKNLTVLGYTSLPMEEILSSSSELSVEKWLNLSSTFHIRASEPTRVRVSFSFTPPACTPPELRIVRPRLLSTGSCLFPVIEKFSHAKNWRSVVDDKHSGVISLKMREFAAEKTKDKLIRGRQVIAITVSQKRLILAESAGASWSLMDSKWTLEHTNQSDKTAPVFELVGHKMIKICVGRKLDYELTNCSWAKSMLDEEEFMTAIEFSSQHPYGKAVALFNFKTGSMQAKESWFVLPGIISAFILENCWRKKWKMNCIYENLR